MSSSLTDPQTPKDFLPRSLISYGFFFGWDGVFFGSLAGGFGWSGSCVGICSRTIFPSQEIYALVISSRSFFRLNSISATLCSRVLCSSGICLLFVPLCQIFSKMIGLHHGGHMARAADFPSALITESFSTPALRICRLGHRSFGPIILAALENLSSHPGRAAAKGRRVVSLFCELVSLSIVAYSGFRVSMGNQANAKLTFLPK